MRHPDWPSRLVDFIESRRNSPFVWGSNDCLCFAADALIAAMFAARPRLEAELATLVRGY